jgi:hypothetical protein
MVHSFKVARVAVGKAVRGRGWEVVVEIGRHSPLSVDHRPVHRPTAN